MADVLTLRVTATSTQSVLTAVGIGQVDHLRPTRDEGTGASSSDAAAAADDEGESPLSWMDFKPEAYPGLLASKVASVSALLAGHLSSSAPPTVFASTPRHFRQRCRFAMARFPPVRGPLSYGLFTANRGAYDDGPALVAVSEFPIASQAINALMPTLLAELNAHAALGDGLAAVHFLSTQSGDMLVTLIYGAPLPAGWRDAAHARLRVALGVGAVVGRARGECVALERDHVTEVVRLSDGRALRYVQVEGSFSNPSAAMCEHTLDFLCGCAAAAAAGCAAPPTLLELYSGNGNHTVALARHFRRVLAVEIDRRLCDAAAANLRANGVANVSILCAPSARFCKPLLRSLRRAPPAAAVAAGDAEGGAEGGGAEGAAVASGVAATLEAADAWLWEARQRTDVILVDPPRCGLDAETLALVARFDHVLYVSCNPSALRANLDAALGATHEVVRWAVFDHFAYSPHLECAVHLTRRGRA